MSYESSQPQREAIPWEWSAERFADLSPSEIVAAHRLSWNHDISMFLETLPRQDLVRAKAVYSAFVGSPIPADREWLAFGGIEKLTVVDHGAGVALWDQLIRDVDPDVRHTVAQQLDEQISNAGVSSFDSEHRLAIHMRHLASPALDEEYLRSETGLTRQDAYDLFVSYAYAENGQFLHDVGEAALAKLAVVQPPAA
ncbi:hypothetical protein ABH935_007168 [Catenulispora sp. GAS73]|uniref:hypothetical protein n=1 Tax=Catenulispora sp. GAS73 TaxID=3156269 RepID=UPI003514208E